MPELLDQDIQQIELYFEDLKQNLEQTFSESNYGRIKNALTVAYDAHKTQIRKVSGEPYILHPIAVAKIICNEVGFGSESVVCALLHDVVEDSKGRYTIKDLRGLFGQQVAGVVNGLTKITSEGKKNESEDGHLSNDQLESLKKVSLLSIGDVRVIYIKIADRLHNMRTMEGMKQNSQLRKAGENLLFYSPFAYRLGLYLIKKELEDGSFEINNPGEYNALRGIINEEENSRNSLFKSYLIRIEEKLKSEKANVKVEYFTKSVYSIWKKMEERHKPFEEIHNYRSIRVVFDSPSDESVERRMVYMLFVEITNLFQEKKNSRRDYIKEGKINGFQALVFDIIVERPLTFIEIHIMSQRMRLVNDRGPLSLKQRSVGLKKSYRQSWIENLNKQLKSDSDDPLDFIQDITSEFVNEIVVYTPKGQPIRLPRGSTVLDFAFHIHSDIGLSCAGATVDNDFAKITYVLHGGQRVDVHKTEKIALQEYWIDFVKTKRAKDVIRAYWHKKRNKVLLKGREIFNAILRDAGIENKKKAIDKLIQKYSLNQNEIFYKIGDESITKELIYRNLINPNEKANKGFWQTIFNRNAEKEYLPIQSKEFKPNMPYVVDERLIYSDYFIAHCCNPIPGDDSVIYKNKHGALIIHQMKCHQATQFFAAHGKNAVAVKWMDNAQSIFPVKLYIRGVDRVGVIRDITELISFTMDINMHSINITIQSRTRFLGDIVLFVTNKAVLDLVIIRLGKIKGVDNCIRENRFEMEE